MNQLVRAAGRGLVAGTLATATMSASMLAFQRLGLMGRMPPRLVTERLLGALGLRWRTSRRTRKGMSTILHFGFGAIAGMLFESSRVALRKASPSPVAAIAYGLSIYAGSYAGWIPAVGALPPPHLDRPGRQPAMILAHVVYGATLAAVLRRIKRPATEGGSAWVRVPRARSGNRVDRSAPSAGSRRGAPG